MSLAEKQAEQKRIALQTADALFHYKWIARAAGITDETLKKFRDEDEEFSQGLDLARSRFIKNNMRKAKPDFLLETADRETFGKKEEGNTVNVIQLILNKYGGSSEGVIDEVPRPVEIAERASQDTT